MLNGLGVGRSNAVEGSDAAKAVAAASWGQVLDFCPTLCLSLRGMVLVGGGALGLGGGGEEW